MDVLQTSAEEVAGLADLTWHFPDRPPTALELANDMRTLPGPERYLEGSRRMFAEEEWADPSVRGGSARAASASARAARRMLELLTPEAARVELATSSSVGAKEAPRQIVDPFLGVTFREFDPSPELWASWREAGAAGAATPGWWSGKHRGDIWPR